MSLDWELEAGDETLSKLCLLGLEAMRGCYCDQLSLGVCPGLPLPQLRSTP